jgi:putative transposase
VNQLCNDLVRSITFETATRYQRDARWNLHLLILMPNHLHMLIAIAGDVQLSALIRDFKRITARLASVEWQRDFFDHRLRHDESLWGKYQYLVANPVRAGLTGDGEQWPLSHVDVAAEPNAGD